MKKYFESVNRKSLMITVLVSAFILTTSVAYAAMTLSTDTISGSGALNINPTGQPVTVNGDFTVTGTCTGCGITASGNNTFTGSNIFSNTAQITGLTLAASSPQLRVLNFSYTDTHTGNLNNGILYGDITISPAGNVDVTKAGGIDLTYSTDPAYTGTISYANPIYGAFYGEGTNNATHVTAIDGDLELDGTGTWNNATIFRGDMYNNGTISTFWRGLWLKSYGNDGTMGTYEGVRIESMGGTITNNYGLHIMSMANVTGSPTVNHAINYDDKFIVDSVGAVTATNIKTTPITVSALPTCNSGAKGTFAYVTDSNTATWGATIAGGGANNVGASCNGTNWTVFSK